MRTRPLAGSGHRIIPFLILILVTGFLVLAVYPIRPPAVAPAGSPPAEFSADRAAGHLEHFALAPHPTGSAENARVRGYLVAAMATLGLAPEIQTTAVFRPSPRIVLGATVSNIIGRLRGTDNTRAVMLAAHYDSVPGSPAVSDDGSGIAALLETARALQAGSPLQNDVIFLMTDGEELGLLGARAFVTEHPWAKEVAVVLNFEARGTRGPSMLFETGADNAWLMRQFAAAVPYPAGYSYLYEFYKRMPNDTDFTVFRQSGMTGLNFAFAEGWERYHTARDDLQNLDLRSLQHDGSYALSLVRRLGNMDLSQQESGDAVYFSFLGKTFHYPQRWAFPLAVAAMLLFAGVLALGLKRGCLSWRGMMLGFAGWMISALFSAAAAHFVWQLIAKTSLVTPSLYGIGYNSELYSTAFLALIAAIMVGFCAAMDDLASGENLAAGAILWWTFAALATGVSFPGASYLFVWPLLLSSLALGIVFRNADRFGVQQRALIWLLPAFAGIVLVAPLPYALLEMLSTNGLVPLALATAMLVGFLYPLVCAMTQASKGWLTAFMTAGAFILFGIAILARGYDSSNPAPDSLFYLLDKDNGQASWVSTDAKTDEWTLQYLGSDPTRGNLREFVGLSLPVLWSSAAVTGLEEPRVSVLRASANGEVRNLRLLVSAPPKAQAFWLELRGTDLLDAAINGKKVGDVGRKGGLRMYYVGIPEDGLLLTVTFPLKANPELRVIAQSEGLPDIPTARFTPRPAHLMPAPWPPFDSSSMVAKTFRNLESLPAGQDRD